MFFGKSVIPVICFFTRCWGTTSATAKSISHLIVDESSLSSDLENVMLVNLQVPQGEILKFIPVESLAVGNEMTTPDFFSQESLLDALPLPIVLS